MTLILTSGVHGKFVVMSSDKRRVYYKYWRNPVTGDLVKTNMPPIVDEKEHIKVTKISDYAIMGTAGYVDLGAYFEKKIAKVILPQDDLMACKLKLEDIVSKALTDPDLPYAEFLKEKDGVQIIISGFYADGLTGMLSLDIAEGGLVHSLLTDPVYYQFYSMVTPVSEYEEVTGELFGMPDKKSKKKTENIKKVKWIHKLISGAHPDLVSSDGVLHVLTYKGNGVIEHKVSDFQT